MSRVGKEAGRRGRVRVPGAINILEVEQLPARGETAEMCAEDEAPAGEGALARFDLMCAAAMPSGMCVSQYLLGSVPFRARAEPQMRHSGVSRSTISARRQRCPPAHAAAAFFLADEPAPACTA